MRCGRYSGEELGDVAFGRHTDYFECALATDPIVHVIRDLKQPPLTLMFLESWLFIVLPRGGIRCQGCCEWRDIELGRRWLH